MPWTSSSLDSVAALVPKAELEGEMGDGRRWVCTGAPHEQRRSASSLPAILTNSQHDRACFTNQLREKVGVMFGNPETTPGGKALKFYASVRVGHPPHWCHREQ
jgi:recombination protein RecA